MTAQPRIVALRPRDLGRPPTDHDKPWRCTGCGSNCWIDPVRRLLALGGAKALCYRCLYPNDPGFNATPDPIAPAAPWSKRG